MMSDSSSSSTPPALTPDVTGLGLEPSKTEKKLTRRQVAFYPNMNSSNKPVKPFSRSAAKRQSVMTLGSIEHLQHYFTKTGLAAKTNPSNKPQSQFVPAIGGRLALQTDTSLESVQEFELPPSPTVPQSHQPAFPLFAKTFETDPDAFLPGVVEDLAAITRVWGIDNWTSRSELFRDHTTAPSSSASPSPPSSAPNYIDVLSLLQTTTRAIRSVRNYVIALPDESAGTLRIQYRNKTAAGDPIKRHKSKSPQPDPLSMIRKSALEVLSALRDLEERSRIPLTDEAYDAQSDRGSSQGHNPHSRVASPSSVLDDDTDSQPFDPDMSISFIRVQGRYDSIPVWEDENDQDIFNMSEEERDKRERWDDKLVLGGGWLYRQDTRLEDLAKERGIVDRYTCLVDDVLFGGKKDGVRGWERERERITKRDRESRHKNRRVSAGDVESSRSPSERPSRPTRRVVSSGMLDSIQQMTLSEEPGEMEVLSEEEESFDEEDLPEWAKRTSFADDPIGRAHALLLALLPDDLRATLLPPSPKTAFLRALSSGQLLCVAYNTGVRRSRKPWGFISVDSIHDIIALEQSSEEGDEKAKTGWTFRRSDNLRLWAGALKLRYLLPLIIPSTPGRPDQIPIPSSSSPARNTASSSPSTPRIRFASNEPPLNFDPRLVARREEEWESMLEATLLRWVTAVMEERRGER
ncbi:hypothetical protein V8B97DRAFT_1981179 [Scleroderma yunnanense]